MGDLFYFIEVVIGGLLSGVMYSLVAIGFVLIYKSSGVFNFAQGTMLLFAGLTFVKLTEQGVPFWYAFSLTLAIMVIMGVLIERFIMRPLANQSLLSLFMATVGLSIFLEGFSQGIWDSAVHGLKLGEFVGEVPNEEQLAAISAQACGAGSSLLGCFVEELKVIWFHIMSFVSRLLSSDPIFLSDYIPGFDVLISAFDVFASSVAGLMIIGLSIFFQKTHTGMSLRAVSDDHLAAMAVGIPLSRIWAIVWAVTGIIGLVAGLLWADRISVSFTLTQVVLKGLPVILVGGLTSIPGAIVGGFIIGVSEKLGEIYVADIFGGQGIENWFGYIAALLFILIRPAGLFGEKEVGRV